MNVPREEMEQLGLQEGQSVPVEVRPAALHVESQLAADLRPPLERVKERPGLKKALRILGS